MDVLRYAYYELNQKHLPVFGVKKKNLKGYSTTKNDRKKNISKMPPESIRIDQFMEIPRIFENLRLDYVKFNE